MEQLITEYIHSPCYQTGPEIELKRLKLHYLVPKPKKPSFYQPLKQPHLRELTKVIFIMPL